MKHPAPSSSSHHCRRCLSTTDVEVVVQLAAGTSRAEIARGLHMSEANVAYHLDRIAKKLSVRGVGAMVGAALVAGILTAERWPIVATGSLCAQTLAAFSA